MSQYISRSANRILASLPEIEYQRLEPHITNLNISVGTVAQTLQRAGIISYSRGRIKILNREALSDVSCEC